MDVSLSRGRGVQLALAASVSLNIALLGVTLWPDSEPEAPAAVAEIDVVEDDAVPSDEVAAAEVAPDEPAAETAEPEAAREPGESQVTVALVQGSIPQTLAEAAKPYGDNLSATLSRLLVWDLDLRKDLRPNDRIETQWRLDGSTDVVAIDAARFHSNKFNRTTTAYRFQANGDKYASYWSADGTEIPHRLRNSPLAEYEQVTSLLKDRPTHHGMDFKVDVGTPVLATFEGVVTRVNWNWKYNGNSVEVKRNDGVVAKFLHLSENKVKEGDRVRVGDVVALSGNTGHSTGPHLHYQLNNGSKVIDPIDYHGTDRRKLPDSDRAAFTAMVKAADARLDAAGALAVK